MMPPTSHTLSCSICKANRMPSSQRFLFGHLAVLTVSLAPGTEEGLPEVRDFIVIKETSKTEKQRADPPANCKGEVGVMTPDLSQERTTDLYLHFQPLSSSPSPYLFFLPLIIRRKEKAMRRKKEGERTYTQRNPGRGKRAHYYWEGKK